MTLPDVLIEPVVRAALIEDLGRGGDVTASLVGRTATLRAQFRVRADGVVAGLSAARIACRMVDPALSFAALAEEGAHVVRGDVVATVDGPAASVLTAERTALNFLTHLSGVATLTAKYVDAVRGTRATIAATRKTLPGLRALQKAAVVAGGGAPHRYGLDDAVLVKDNHIAACGSIAAAVRNARSAAGHMRVVEIEIDRLQQLEEALAHGPDVVLLDNFTLADLRAAVAQTGGRAVLEASGGVALETVRAIAETGVDVISVGALTHSAPALDIGLDGEG